MLFQSADMAKPHRIQTAFVSENEVKEIANFIKKHNEPSVDDIAITSQGNHASPNALFSATMDDGADDYLFEEAKQTVEEAGKHRRHSSKESCVLGTHAQPASWTFLKRKGLLAPRTVHDPVTF